MFDRLGQFVFRFRFLVVGAWIAAALVAVAWAPDLAEVGSADQSSFLSANAESMAAHDALSAGFPDEASASSATIAFSRAGGLTDADRDAIAATASWLTTDAPAGLRAIVKNVVGIADHPELKTQLRSADGTVELLQVELTVSAFDPKANDATGLIRAHLATAVAPSGLAANVTGSVGIGADYLASILQATERTTIVTIILVVLVLLLIYRAPLAAMVPLATIAGAYLVARGLLGYLGSAGWHVSSLLGTFVVVLVFGVGTDYTIFLISRFREEVGGRDWGTAVGATVQRIGAVIAASAATVAIGLGSMVVGQFVMFQTTGPALAIAVLVTLAAGLTLAPALLGIFGHYLFWPRHQSTLAGSSDRGFFAGLARLISRRPLAVAVVVLFGLGLPAIATTGLRQSFDVLADLPATSDAKAGFNLVADHFDKGQLLPVMVVVQGGSGADLGNPGALAELRTTTDRLLATPGVRRVESLIAPSGDGTTPDGFRPSIQLADMATRFTVPHDPVAGLKKLLDPDTTTGLRSAGTYLAALGTGFPDIAATSGFGAVSADIARMPEAIAALRTQLRVSTQLDRIAGQLRLAAAAGVPAAAWVVPLSGYLDELVRAYPQVAGLPAYGELRAALGGSPGAADPLAAAAAVAALSPTFASLPDAILVPTGAAADAGTTALQAEIATLGTKLPAELSALSKTLGARADGYLIPTGLASDAQESIDRTREAYLSPDGTVTRLYAITADDPYSPAAFATVAAIRSTLVPQSGAYGTASRILVGGQTAMELDLQTTINEDFVRVAGLTVLGVLLVLALLLRSLVAPLYLVGTVLLSYGCTLGLGALAFQDLLGQSGMNYFLPLMVFVLLVALGSDYNIFLMSRVREESETRGTRDGIRVASARTGPVITSAGIILAGTFLAMVASPLTVLFQVGLMVAVGVLIDTFIVRSLLVPAITTLLGDAAWWPFARGGRPHAPVSRAGTPALPRPEPGRT